MISPAVPLFAAAALGALYGVTTDALGWGWGLVGCCMALVAWFAPKGSLRKIAIVTSALALGAGLAGHQRAQWVQTVQALPKTVAVYEGIVREANPTQSGKQRLTLDVSGVIVDVATTHPQSRAQRARLWVTLARSAIRLPVHPGDRVRVMGRAKALRPADSPGTFDAALFGVARGLHGRLAIYQSGQLAVVERQAEWTPFANARARLRQRLQALLSPREASVLLALIVGETAGFDAQEIDIYRRVGAGHLLAVSGLQVSLLALFLFVLVRSVVLLLPGGRRGHAQKVAAAIALLSVWAFVLLCGAPPSCVRAAGMATAGLLAVLLARRVKALDTLGLAGLVTVLLAPTSVIDPSFLLSYGAIIGLVAVARPSGLDQMGPSTSLAGMLLAMAASAGAAGLMTLPLSAHLFGEVAPGGLLANVVLVPVAALLQVPAIGLGAGGAWLQSSALAHLGATAAGILEALCEGLGQVCGGALGGIMAVAVPSGPATLALGVASAGLVASLVRRRKDGALVFVALAATALLATAHQPPGLRIDVLPVGQGDGAVFEFPSGKVMLVDGGGVWDAHLHPGQDVVLPFLRRCGIAQIDVMVLSHPHPDHLLGLLDVLREMPVGELWVPSARLHDGLLRRLLRLARAKGVPVRDQPELLGGHPFGQVQVQVLAPAPEDGSAIYGELGANDNSLVLRFVLGGDSALWPGDIEAFGEEYLLRDHLAQLRSTVLKAPHHGSKTSSSAAFVAAVAPQMVVFPTGPGNNWGFPSQRVVARYQKAGAQLFDTAQNGEVTFWLTGYGVQVRTYRDRGQVP